MPSSNELNELLKVFKVFVVLGKGFGLKYDIEALKKAADIFYFPIPDLSAPSLKQLLDILQWIEARAREDKKVLIHCIGGSSRSETVAVAYLIYSQGLSLRDALLKVHPLKSSAVKTEEQMDVL
ncbi:dual specificity protein phosphatase family protein [Pyrococcus kukulkanii]|uniref:protein-tyrosine phosphatase family protein n=1 Tax=Pyrococcus kukulkanii TaxID=1609559 RepID=UPI003564B8F1